MGEAKRRREAAAAGDGSSGGRQLGGPAVYLDMMTGERRTGKYGGDPMAVMTSLLDQAAALVEGGGDRSASTMPATTVPCNGCTSCCWHKLVEVEPGIDAVDKLDCRTLDDGSVALNKRPDGACVHLTDAGCGVYEHRPWTCRGYDCRLLSMCGVIELFEHGRQSPRWVFDRDSDDGNALLAACQFLGISYQAHAMRRGKPRTAGEVLLAVLPKLPEARRQFAALMRMTPEQQREALGGVDPAAITHEDVRQAFLKMTDIG
jgi:Putative zinc- or iron-chelating domain